MFNSMFKQGRMPGRCCFVALFASLLCLCVLRSTEGQLKICNLEGGYDINTLRKVPYWKVRVDSKFDCSSVSQGAGNICEMYLSFCQLLPINKSDPAGYCREIDERMDQPRNASVCMVINGTLSNETANTFGTYDPHVAPFNILKVEDGKTGFESVSYGGRAFRATCNETITFVQFRCDEQANWSTVADRNVTKYLVNAGFSNIDPCLFFINFNYKGACVAAPITTNPPITTYPPVTQSNNVVAPGIPGIVLIIIFLLAVVTYIAVGSGINLALGKRSATDVFPNYAFWIGFPYLLLDGVRFSFNLVTCFYFYKTASPLSSQGKSRGQYETLPE